MANSTRSSFISRLLRRETSAMMSVAELNKIADLKIQGPLIERKFIEPKRAPPPGSNDPAGSVILWALRRFANDGGTLPGPHPDETDNTSLPTPDDEPEGEKTGEVPAGK